MELSSVGGGRLGERINQFIKETPSNFVPLCLKRGEKSKSDPAKSFADLYTE